MCATAGLCVFIAAMGVVAQQAYDIRMYAIRDYGYVIHEFDPWFNYRATEYLAANGWHAFFHWFDYMSWYPLGRPVGTTIYPGMQITAVAIWRALGKLGSAISLNDVCCLVPAWFGVSASILVGLFAAECSGRKSAGAFAALIMAIVPAHIMRSVAGGLDPRSVATTALVATFYCWVRALRDRPTARDGEATADSYAFGLLCGLAYVYMVAAWGGRVRVPLVAGWLTARLILLLGGRYSSKLHRAYSLFYVIGTAGATRVWKRRVQLAMPAAALLVVATAAILPTGYFGPLSSRVRGLFLKHTRTGNPLVDSVAEHQPGSTMMYRQYLQNVYPPLPSNPLAVYPLVPCGFALSLLRLTDANTFLLLYGAIAYFFASKMARRAESRRAETNPFGGAYCHRMAEGSSRPQIMFKATYSNGQTVMVDDYREAWLAYWWLRDKTPEDARVMAWWDYGYQITGIANRTSVADGNTGTTSDLAHSYARHLADYVLVWAGGGGDDLAKSPHLARIGNAAFHGRSESVSFAPRSNSVFHGHCGNDPTCSNFGFYRDRSPTPMMEKSLLYKLVLNGQRGVAVNSSYFEHAYSSKHGKARNSLVRIYKVKRVSLKSKLWAADPANRVCDAPGSWYCEFINSRRNFKQLSSPSTR
ncbi:oligosaccharyl transferase [Emiliania huxleyi CCMP1516]|uniref:dolichyl-diphosphooligosaccharide--protein glycotransferase n=2 Tax=Emiliania huxleyi TaxID=2903 RepID=A0A0D3I7Y1_EMIH1|nr:oligosaccharyl transferase [Emiliania huxleyi CCMP1516]EOD07366.1 oligosaccharyl transferase [Emiliania huxleyi CCMP1516]|eukprot:XP_005759795.1 oligosaccharyl transferase [Emiliania huxleyi CCMP1516]